MKKILLLVLVTVLLSSFASASLVAQWDFSAGSGSTDTDQINSYTLTLDNTSYSPDYPIYPVDGDGSPYSLNLSDSNSWANTTALNTHYSTDWSIALWFRNNNSLLDNRFLASWYDGTASNPDAFTWKLRANRDGIKQYMQLYIQAEPDEGDGVNNFITDTINLNNDTWYFGTVTYDQTTDVVKMYLNGVDLNANETTQQGTPPTLDTSTGFALFGNGETSGASIRGLFDTIRVYDHVLSPSEVNDLYLSATSNITLEFHDNITSTFNITTWNVTINNNSYYWTAHPTPTNISSDNTLININISAPYYLNRTIIGHNTTNNVDYNLQPYRFNLTVEFYNVTGDKEQGFMVYLNGTETFNQSDVNGLFSYMVKNGTYNLTVDNPSFNLYNQSLQLNLSSHFINITGTVTNSVNFTFKDDKLNTIITDNVSIALLSDVANYNKTTETGSIVFELLIPTTYTVRYSALPTYNEKFYSLTILDRTTQSVTLYLSNSSNTADVIATVTDQNLKKVEGVKLEVFKYSDAQGGYVLSEILTTNFAGQAVFQAYLNQDLYKFRLSYDDEVKLYTNPTKVFSTELSFQINTEEPVGQGFTTYRNVAYNLSYNNNTKQVTFDYVDSSASVTKGCLYLYKLTGLAKTLLNSSCISSNGGSITLGNVNESFYNQAEAYVTIPTLGDVFLDSINIGSVNKVTGQAGIFYYIIVQIVVLFIFRWNIVAGLIIFPLPMVGAIMMGLLAFPIWIGIAVEVVAVILSFVVTKNS